MHKILGISRPKKFDKIIQLVQLEEYETDPECKEYVLYSLDRSRISSIMSEFDNRFFVDLRVLLLLGDLQIWGLGINSE